MHYIISFKKKVKQRASQISWGKRYTPEPQRLLHIYYFLISYFHSFHNFQIFVAYTQNQMPMEVYYSRSIFIEWYIMNKRFSQMSSCNSPHLHGNWQKRGNQIPQVIGEWDRYQSQRFHWKTCTSLGFPEQKFGPSDSSSTGINGSWSPN